MNVTFHALASLAIAHVAAPHSPRGPSPRPRVVAAAVVAAVLSHGVLDGLRHTYPLPSALDVALALALVAFWMTLIHRALRPLLALVFVGAVLPDLVDLGPAIVARRLGRAAPWPAVFPWHWAAGSGSIYHATGRLAVVSLVNHAIVVAVCAALIATHPAAFRHTR